MWLIENFIVVACICGSHYISIGLYWPKPNRSQYQRFWFNQPRAGILVFVSFKATEVNYFIVQPRLRTTRLDSWRRQWHPTPVLLPGKSHGWRSLVGWSPWGRSESDMTERLHFHFSPSCIGEGDGNPLQYSCLENPRDRGAWWAAVYGVAQSQTRLKWLSSSSSRLDSIPCMSGPARGPLKGQLQPTHVATEAMCLEKQSSWSWMYEHQCQFIDILKLGSVICLLESFCFSQYFIPPLELQFIIKMTFHWRWNTCRFGWFSLSAI